MAFLGEPRKAQGQEKHPETQLMANPYLLCNEQCAVGDTSCLREVLTCSGQWGKLDDTRPEGDLGRSCGPAPGCPGAV